MSERQRISSGAEWEHKFSYSRAVRDGEYVFVSGSTGYDYETGEISTDPSEQARQTLNNISKALAEAGASLDDVVRVRYIVPDRDDFFACQSVLQKAFAKAMPAATLILANLITSEIKIEIEVTAKISSP